MAIHLEAGTAALQAAGAVPTLVRKTVTFTGAAGAGAVGTVALFTVSGDVAITRVGFKCTTNLAEAGASATINIGVVGNVDYIDSSITAAGTAGQWWSTNQAWGAAAGGNLISDGNNFEGALLTAANVILTIADQNVTAGVVVVYLFYIPLSAGATVTAA